MHGVSLTYGKGQKAVEALQSVSFDIRPNELTVIVGPSGCGKSSLLYLAAGLNEVTDGEIEVNGRRVTGPGPDRGMVFQSYTLFPWLTVRNNVEYGLRRKNLGTAERRAISERYLAEVGLTVLPIIIPSNCRAA